MKAEKQIQPVFSLTFQAKYCLAMMAGLLLETNIIAIAAILVLVMIISLLVVNRLNLHFYRMCNVVDAMSRSRFSAPKPPRSMFHEVSVLIDLVDKLSGH